MVVGCVTCDWEGDIPRRAKPVRARYKCHRCRQPITRVSVFSWADWIEERADTLERQRQKGELGTRLQTRRDCDRNISADGIGAELAACMILAPWKLTDWMHAATAAGSNRGCDLPAEWFADGRPIEVKYTSALCGHLLVRPPRNTPGPMLKRYIDDSIYLLLTGTPYTYTAVGWAGRTDFLKCGRLNPIPIRGRQRECWGIHASDLNDMKMLFELLGTPRKARALRN